MLAERYAGKPDELDREIFTEHYRAGRIDPYEWDPYFDVIEGEADDEEERKEGLYVDYGLDELARFPLKGKIKAKEIAERIVLEAQKIHEEQTALAIECRKQCAKRRARVRQKQASVPDTPTPTN